MNPAPPILQLEALSHHYGKRAALTDVSLCVERGEIVGLLGPNGCGKSTILALISGLARVRAGRITANFDGRPAPLQSAAGRKAFGMVFQSPSLDSSLSASENLVLSAMMHGLKGRAGRDKAAQLLTWAGLTDRATERVKNLSGGMRRRLEIARALVGDPALLLLDEPTAGLDASAFARVWDRLVDLRDTRGLSILVATHRPEEAARCDRLVLMREGRVIANDSPAALIRSVADDLIVIEADNPSALLQPIIDTFGMTPRIDPGSGHVLIECDAGHELVVSLVEAFPRGRIRAISLRRPTLADAFVKLAGEPLEAAETLDEAA